MPPASSQACGGKSESSSLADLLSHLFKAFERRTAMHFLHSRIAARRCFTGCVELHRMPAVRQLSSTSLRRDVDDDLASTTNEHLLPVLRAQLKLRQLRLEALDRGNRQMMERQKIPKLPSQRPQKNQRAIIEEFSTFIERIEQHPRRIERADQAKEVKGMTPAFMARLERILDGKVVSGNQGAR